MDAMAFCEGVRQRLKTAGFEVHCGGESDDWLAGRWWWTLCRDGWSGIEAQPDDSATEGDAWLSALECALAEAVISMDGLGVRSRSGLHEQASRTLHPEVAT